MALNLGGLIRLTYAVSNDVGAPTNPATATLTITRPDGTSAPGIVVDVTPDVTGLLVYDYLPTQAGRHDVHWATTGPVSSDDDVFYAEPPGQMLVSVDSAIRHLRAGGVITSAADREQLQWLCMAATAAVEDDLNRYLVRRTVTATSHTDNRTVWLRGPIISITSVSVDGGAPLASTSYSLVGSHLWTSTQWGYATGPILVTYVAGYPDPPKAARAVALNLVQSMYQQSQQAPAPFLDESAEFAASTALAGLPDPLRRAYDSLRTLGAA